MNDKTRQIRALTQEKIMLQDRLMYEKNKVKVKQLEDDLYEINDTIDKLTNGVWYQDESEHEIQLEKAMKHYAIAKKSHRMEVFSRLTYYEPVIY